MTTEHPNNSAIQEGATAVTTHRIHSTHQAEYESWLDEIGSLCKTYPGHLDVQIISPIDGLTGTYTVPPRRAGSPSRNLLATLAFHAAGLVNLARDSY